MLRPFLSKEIQRDLIKCVFPTFMFLGTVRRFLENHGENIETVVFAVSDVEEVCAVSFSLLRNRVHHLTLNCALLFYYELLVLFQGQL